MFEGLTRANAEIEARFFTELTNSEAANRYEKDLRYWLHDTQIKQAAGITPEPLPKVPMQVEYYLVAPAPSTTISVRTLSVPVSKLTLADIMPKYGTDINAVGGPVGGPIPNRPGDFYAASNASPQLGDDYTQTSGPNQGVYIFKAEGFAGLSRFWRKIA